VFVKESVDCHMKRAGGVRAEEHTSFRAVAVNHLRQETVSATTKNHESQRAEMRRRAAISGSRR
jgi:hypothetical protein